MASPTSRATSPWCWTRHCRARVLGFGAWLPADQAQALEGHVALLRERGQSFHQDLVSQNGRHLEADGRAIGGRVVMRVRDVSGDRLELVRLREVQAKQTGQLDNLRALLDQSPHPAWTRGPDHKLDWVNAAYAHAVDAKAPEDAVKRQLELLDRQAREAVAKARELGEVWRQRQHVVVAGERRLMDVVAAALPAGTGGMADDLSELETLRADHARQMESHIRTLDQLATGVAIFDRSKKLVFANAAYRQLWSLDQAFLDQGPSDSEILDRLRAARRLPEQADYRDWKKALFGRLSRPGAGAAGLAPARRADAARRLRSQSARRDHLSVRRRHRALHAGIAI